MLWVPSCWDGELATVETLVKMRYLVDQGLFDAPIENDKHARGLQRRAHESALSNLGYDALHAIKEGLPVAALHLLLEAGVSVNHREENNYHDTLLTAATRKLCAPVVQLLIKNGAKLDVVESCGFSPLRLAMKHAENANFDQDCEPVLKMLDRLLEAGANPNYTEHYYAYDEERGPPSTALVDAACMGWVAGMERLIKSGARADSRLGGATMGRCDILEIANNFRPKRLCQGKDAYENFNAVLDLMLTVGANLDIADENQNTALTQAVRTGELGIALALIDRGASTMRLPGQCTLAHLFAISADFEDPYAHLFLSRMDSGFWREKDDDGNTAFDMLQKIDQEGFVAPHVEPWLAFAAAALLQSDPSLPPPAISRPRARL